MAKKKRQAVRLIVAVAFVAVTAKNASEAKKILTAKVKKASPIEISSKRWSFIF